MSLHTKLLNVGVVLIVLIPVVVLFLRRWSRSELTYHGVMGPPSAFEPKGTADQTTDEVGGLSDSRRP